LGALRRDAHDMWNKGIFALKPLELSADKRQLTIQFFWQPQYNHQLGSHVDLLKEPLSSKGLCQVKIQDKTRNKPIVIPYSLTLTRVDKPSRDIQSGEIFTNTTDDPQSKPLPSWQLLEMQWFLQRITAMSGATETPDLDLNDDDDMSPGPILVPDDEGGDIRCSFDRMYEWIPTPSPLQDNVPDMAKPAIMV
jgi:hypothetical protein